MTEGPPLIFDRKTIALRRERARRSESDAFLARMAAQGIGERLAAVKRSFENGYVLDTSDGAMVILDDWARQWDYATAGEKEALPPAYESNDLAISVLSLQTVNDLPGVLRQLLHVLKPDGLFLAAMFCSETLTELRQSLAAAEIETTGGVSPRVAPFADVRDLGGLLQRAGFALPVADVERTVVRYGDFMALVHDLRALGETNALVERSRKPIRRAMLAATAQHYAENFSDPDGKLRATFDIVYLTGWAPHESQQRPLVPGSAKARLADALGTRELRSGDAPPKRQR
ncbi:MAG TPA: methyltransferase domain-containing protein [Rhizomicrobium sp.]|nr:methyltransferase domain-containing protein [Rhizomicrobium sp.]